MAEHVYPAEHLLEVCSQETTSSVGRHGCMHGECATCAEKGQ